MIGKVLKYGGLFIAVVAAVTLSVCFVILCVYFIAALYKGVRAKLRDQQRRQLRG